MVQRAATTVEQLSDGLSLSTAAATRASLSCGQNSELLASNSSTLRDCLRALSARRNRRSPAPHARRSPGRRLRRCFEQALRESEIDRPRMDGRPNHFGQCADKRFDEVGVRPSLVDVHDDFAKRQQPLRGGIPRSDNQQKTSPRPTWRCSGRAPIYDCSAFAASLLIFLASDHLWTSVGPS